MSRVVLIAAVVLLAASVSSCATAWDVSPIYDGGMGAGDCSLAINSAGVPFVSYAADGGLHLAVRVLGGWTSELVADAGFFGGWSSVALNGISQPAIAFIDSSSFTANYLRYAYRSGGAWLVETVDDVGWLPDHVMLAFDPAGHACIAYCRTAELAPERVHVCFAARTQAGGWSIAEVAQVGSVTAPSLVIDGAGRPCIAFVDSFSGQLKVASREAGGAWSFHTVEGSFATPVLGSASAAADPAGATILSYFLGTAGSDRLALRFARHNGVSWDCETVATVANEGVYQCSVACRRGPVPMVAYYDTDSECLRCARKLGGRWSTEVVDPAQQAGIRPALKLDLLGNAHLAYFGNLSFGVRYAWSATPVRDAKLLADGDLVQISGAVATSESGELGPRVYVQDQERTCGIQLSFSGAAPSLTRGMVLDIQGSMATVDGERVVADPLVEEIGVPVAVRALALTNTALGGGDLDYTIGPPARGQRGIDGAAGLNNIGLLVSTFGRYTRLGDRAFLLDDGSGIGVKCIVPVGVTLYPTWHYLRVTGISSCEPTQTGLARLLRVRSAADIVALF